MWKRVGLPTALALMLIAVPALALSPVILFFSVGSSSLDSRALEVVDYTARFIRHADVREIEIIGNADSVGSAAYNVRLSRRRAEAVHDALLARGMSGHVVVRITAAGEARPIGEAANGVSDPQNRNVQILFGRLCTDVEGNRMSDPACQTPLSD